MPGMFLENMDKTFNTPGDILPQGWHGIGKRIKYIHTVGVVGKVKFIKNPANTYTGIF